MNLLEISRPCPPSFVLPEKKRGSPDPGQGRAGQDRQYLAQSHSQLQLYTLLRLQEGINEASSPYHHRGGSSPKAACPSPEGDPPAVRNPIRPSRQPFDAPQDDLPR